MDDEYIGPMLALGVVALPIGLLIFKKFNVSKLVAIPATLVVSTLVFAALALPLGVLLDRADRECRVLLSEDGGCVELMLLVDLLFALPVLIVAVIWLGIALAINGAHKSKSSQGDPYS